MVPPQEQGVLTFEGRATNRKSISRSLNPLDKSNRKLLHRMKWWTKAPSVGFVLSWGDEFVHFQERWLLH